MQRSSGVLMPIFSLPNEYGIGSFGKESFKFIDYLSSAGQKVWQILPLVQTGYGNSPYSSICSYSFNPYFISVDDLIEKGLVTENEANFAKVQKDGYIDYGNLHSVRFPLLRKAFTRFDRTEKDFVKFLKDKDYFDYAMYMALKFASGQKHFYEWADEYKFRRSDALEKFYNDYKEEVIFWQFVQYLAKTEWLKLKKYANKKGIKILGDIPLYVALDSVDVWKNPILFKLDENLMPKKVAGVPPDYFCSDGQLWGNPVYDYFEHAKDGYAWWIERLKKTLDIYDFVRIDHFRAFDRYYEVDAGRTDAKVGEWIDVPSKEFFTAIHQHIDKNRIIAEDLGIIDDGVRELLKWVEYPGMKVLSFAFNGEENNLYLPKNIDENCVCYTGTHDNDTLLGLINSCSEWDKNNLYNGVRNSLSLFNMEMPVFDDESLASAIIELGFSSKANLFIIPFADILKKGTEYRINEPGTVKDQNWAIRFSFTEFSKETAMLLKDLTEKYDR